MKQIKKINLKTKIVLLILSITILFFGVITVYASENNSNVKIDVTNVKTIKDSLNKDLASKNPQRDEKKVQYYNENTQ